jgi:YidC/Oxa1 family membrane protein insertase
VIFVDTPMKVMNPEYKKIGIEPINIWIRNEIGTVLHLDEINHSAEVVTETMENAPKYKEKILALANDYIYNLDCSAKAGATYIIRSLQEKSKLRNQK